MSFRWGANMTRRLLGLAFGLALAQGSALAADYGFPFEPPPIATNPFLGGYAAVGGAYGTGSPRSFSMASSFLGSTFGDAGLAGNGSPAGWSGVAAGGYNMTFGPALIGIELDGRWGDEKFAGNGAASNNSGIGPAGGILYRYNFSNEAGVHLSGRIGAVLGETLIFAKLGAGASKITDTFATNQTAAFRCSSTQFVVPPVGPGFTQCINPLAGGAATFTQTRWVPSMILGVGAERNIGPLFVRGAVEAETLTQDTFTITQPTAPGWAFVGAASSPNTQWTVRASAMAGVRF
jgi:hypothetical protein